MGCFEGSANACFEDAIDVRESLVVDCCVFALDECEPPLVTGSWSEMTPSTVRARDTPPVMTGGPELELPERDGLSIVVTPALWVGATTTILSSFTGFGWF